MRLVATTGLRRAKWRHLQRVVEHGEEAGQLLDAVRHLHVHYSVVGLGKFGCGPMSEKRREREKIGKDLGVPCKDGLVDPKVLTEAIVCEP